jgi:hypothetical protein
MSGLESAEGNTLLRKDFPDDSDDRLEAIFCSVNTESKSIAIACCLSPTEYRDEWDIYSRYKQWAGWPSYAQYFRQYMQQSLVPVGMVAEEQLTISTTPLKVQFGWALTPAGEEFGQPIAAAALAMSVRHNMSLTSVFSRVGSRYDNRAPGNTARILKAIGRGNDRMMDVSMAAGVDYAATQNNLTRLRHCGVINYEAVGSDTAGWAQYEWVEGRNLDEVPPLKRILTRTRRVAHELCSRGISNARDLTVALGYSDPQWVSPILVHLAALGFARPVRWIVAEHQSEISLTDRGRDWLRFVCDVEDALAGGKALSRMRDILFGLDQSLTCKAVELYSKACPNAHPRSAKRVAQVLAFITDYTRQNGVGPRNKDFRSVLRIKNASQFLMALVQRGVLVRSQIGTETRYSTASLQSS